MAKKRSIFQSQLQKLGDELKKLTFKFKQQQTEINQLSHYFSTTLQPTNEAYDQQHLELLQLFYQLYQRKADYLSGKDQKDLKSIIKNYFDIAEAGLLLLTPNCSEIHQFIYGESLEQYDQGDLDYQIFVAKCHLEEYDVPFKPVAIEGASSPLELQNNYIAAIEADFALAFDYHAPDLKEQYITNDLLPLEKTIHFDAIERLLIKRDRTIIRLVSVAEFYPVVQQLIQPAFPWLLDEEETEEQAYYLEEAAKFYKALDLNGLIGLCLDWLQYMQDPIKKLPDTDLEVYVGHIRALRDTINPSYDAFKEQANMDAMALEFFGNFRNMDHLTSSYNFILEDLKEGKELHQLITAALDQDLPTDTGQDSPTQEGISNPLQLILEWVNKKAKEMDEEDDKDEDYEEEDEDYEEENEDI